MQRRQNKLCVAATALSYCLLVLSLMVFQLEKTGLPCLRSLTAAATKRSFNTSFPSPFHYHVEENSPEGTVIADLSVDFIRFYHVNEEHRRQLNFLVFDQSTSSDLAAQLFDVDDRTGVLTTTSRHGQRLDREALCDNAALTGVLTTTSRHGHVWTERLYVITWH